MSNYYFQGKHFETIEEFWEGVQKWQKENATEESFNKAFESLRKDVWINTMIRYPEITNQELDSILEEMLRTFVQKLYELKNE